MNRTFIVENYAENDFGQWAEDGVTGEQGYIDDERSCFWTWDDTECAWQSRPFKGHQVKRRKGKRERAFTAWPPSKRRSPIQCQTHIYTTNCGENGPVKPYG